MKPVELTKNLLRYDTINPPGREEDCSLYLGRLLENAGFLVEFHQFAPGRKNIIARIVCDGSLPICFTGHLDTVPLGNLPWDRNPFEGETDGDLLYGRGSTDMKSGLASMVCAAIDFAKKSRGKQGLTLVLTAGEETGCEGALYLSSLSGVLGEASAIVVGEPTSNQPFLAHKGVLWMRGLTRGATAHGSMPELGDNAIYKMARAVNALEDYQFAGKTHGQLGSPTLNIGTIRGGENINSVPDLAEISIDIRTTPNHSHCGIQSNLRRILGKEVELETLIDVEGFSTSPDAPFIQKLFQILQKKRGAAPKPSCATYFTDGPVLQRSMGMPPMVILGPGEPAMAHQKDEYCSMQNIMESYEIYRELLG